MKSTFSEMVMRHFDFLVIKYGFNVKTVEISERSPEADGLIGFETIKTFVRVVSERWAVGTSIGRIQDDKKRFFLDIATIHEYAVFTESEKNLVCSFDPQDDRKARALIQRTRLLHKRNDSNSAIEDIDSQIADYSIWLQQYAEPFLRGDFSQWFDVYEYKVIRTRAAHIRSGKDEFVRIVGRSENERVSIFQHSLEYLEKLKSENRQES